MICLGIDTSNYTTSAALYDTQTDEMISVRRLLTVKTGEVGLRQADAVFQHMLALPDILGEAFSQTEKRPDAIGVSVSPRDEAGSYMPGFLCGKGAAVSLGAALHIPVRYFSHQAGHIAAAVYSVNRTDLLRRELLAFHVSGGTTEALLVTPDREKIFTVRLLGGSMDLKAGQAIDRVGRMLGLPFPAGPALDALSLQSEKRFTYRPYVKDGRCSLSGLENQCRHMLDAGEAPADIANYCVGFICAALEKITDALIADYPGLPLVYSGGVTSNTLLRRRLTEKYGAVFAERGYASDNAAGIAVLCAAAQGETSIC